MLNLIGHKVPESTRSSAQERKAYDLNQVHTIIQKHLGLDTTIDNSIRLGKRDPAKTRLLKITVASLKFKKEILCNNAKLRDVSDPAWVNSVFIASDLISKQQEKDKAPRARLSKLNATSKIYRIKNGEIVRRENQ